MGTQMTDGDYPKHQCKTIALVVDFDISCAALNPLTSNVGYETVAKATIGLLDSLLSEYRSLISHQHTSKEPAEPAEPANGYCISLDELVLSVYAVLRTATQFQVKRVLSECFHLPKAKNTADRDGHWTALRTHICDHVRSHLFGRVQKAFVKMNRIEQLRYHGLPANFVAAPLTQAVTDHLFGASRMNHAKDQRAMPSESSRANPKVLQNERPCDLTDIAHVGLLAMESPNGKPCSENECGRDIVFITNEGTELLTSDSDLLINDLIQHKARVHTVICGTAFTYPDFRDYSALQHVCCVTMGIVTSPSDLGYLSRYLWKPKGISPSEQNHYSVLWWRQWRTHPAGTYWAAEDPSTVTSSSATALEVIIPHSYRYLLSGKPLPIMLHHKITMEYRISQTAWAAVQKRLCRHGFHNFHNVGEDEQARSTAAHHGMKPEHSSHLPPWTGSGLPSSFPTFSSNCLVYKKHWRPFVFVFCCAEPVGSSELVDVRLSVQASALFLRFLHAVMFEAKSSQLSILSLLSASSSEAAGRWEDFPSMASGLASYLFKLKKYDLATSTLVEIIDGSSDKRSELSSKGIDIEALASLVFNQSLFPDTLLDMLPSTSIYVKGAFESISSAMSNSVQEYAAQRKGDPTDSMQHSDIGCYQLAPDFLVLVGAHKQFCVIFSLAVSSSLSSVSFVFTDESSAFMNHWKSWLSKECFNQMCVNQEAYPIPMLGVSRKSSPLQRYSARLISSYYPTEVVHFKKGNLEALFSALKRSRKHGGFTVMDDSERHFLCCWDSCRGNLSQREAICYESWLTDGNLKVSVVLHHGSAVACEKMALMKQDRLLADCLRTFDSLERVLCYGQSSPVLVKVDAFDWFVEQFKTPSFLVSEKYLPSVPFRDFNVILSNLLSEQVLTKLCHGQVAAKIEPYDSIFLFMCQDQQHILVFCTNATIPANDENQGVGLRLDIYMVQKPEFWPNVPLGERSNDLSSYPVAVGQQCDLMVTSIQKDHLSNFVRMVFQSCLQNRALGRGHMDLALSVCKTTTFALEKMPLSETRIEMAMEAVQQAITRSAFFSAVPGLNRLFYFRPLDLDMEDEEWFLSPCFLELKPGFQLIAYTLDNKLTGAADREAMDFVGHFQRMMLGDARLLAKTSIEDICALASKRFVVSLVSPQWHIPYAFRSLVLGYFDIAGLKSRHEKFKRAVMGSIDEKKLTRTVGSEKSNTKESDDKDQSSADNSATPTPTTENTAAIDSPAKGVGRISAGIVVPTSFANKRNPLLGDLEGELAFSPKSMFIRSISTLHMDSPPRMRHQGEEEDRFIFIDESENISDPFLVADFRQFPSGGVNFSLSVSNVGVVTPSTLTHQGTAFSLGVTDSEMREISKEPRPAYRALLSLEAISYACQLIVAYHVIFDPASPVNIRVGSLASDPTRMFVFAEKKKVLGLTGGETTLNSAKPGATSKAEAASTNLSISSLMDKVINRFPENPPLRTQAFLDHFSMNLHLDAQAEFHSIQSTGSMIESSGFEVAKLFPELLSLAPKELCKEIVSALVQISDSVGLVTLRDDHDDSTLFAWRHAGKIDDFSTLRHARELGSFMGFEDRVSRESSVSSTSKVEFLVFSVSHFVGSDNISVKGTLGYLPFSAVIANLSDEGLIAEWQPRSDAQLTKMLAQRSFHRMNLRKRVESQVLAFLHDALLIVGNNLVWNIAFLDGFGDSMKLDLSFVAPPRETMLSWKRVKAMELISRLKQLVSRVKLDNRLFPMLSAWISDFCVDSFVEWLQHGKYMLNLDPDTDAGQNAVAFKQGGGRPPMSRLSKKHSRSLLGSNSLVEFQHSSCNELRYTRTVYLEKLADEIFILPPAGISKDAVIQICWSSKGGRDATADLFAGDTLLPIKLGTKVPSIDLAPSELSSKMFTPWDIGLPYHEESQFRQFREAELCPGDDRFSEPPKVEDVGSAAGPVNDTNQQALNPPKMMDAEIYLWKRNALWPMTHESCSAAIDCAVQLLSQYAMDQIRDKILADL